ncbi:unnamed protein product [Owenia fusiformis]|uniref:Uncharacterized protein n=1 Tax=Owenia fusiformis TaxID=6347 RepID=A0A8J1XNQ0_OWEFU|nr:unnamed protein product [Owenia fusiformis]
MIGIIPREYYLEKKDAEDICNEKLRKSALATYMTDTDRQDSTDTGADTTDDDDDRRETPKKSTDDDHHEDPETPQHSKETKKSSTKDRVAVLEKRYQSLKRKLNALEDRLLDMEEKPREQNDAESNLIEKVKHLQSTDVQDVIVTLSQQVFTKEELINRSVTGKKSHLGQKPPLKTELYNELQRVCMLKTGCSKDVFRSKFRNLQKVLRRKAM